MRSPDGPPASLFPTKRLIFIRLLLVNIYGSTLFSVLIYAYLHKPLGFTNFSPPSMLILVVADAHIPDRAIVSIARW